MKKSRSGFTLIELLIVITIIALLASIIIASYRGIQGRARDDRRKSDVAAIVKAMEIYYDDNGRYPLTSGSTTISGSWVSSIDPSWDNLVTALVPSATDAVPTDPKNIPTTGAASTGVMYSAKNFSYAVYVNAGSYCGSKVGQMFIIVYRLETAKKEAFTDGTCSGTDLGTSYYDAGASYYRAAR